MLVTKLCNYTGLMSKQISCFILYNMTFHFTPYKTKMLIYV